MDPTIRLGVTYLKEVAMKSPIALLRDLFFDLKRLNPGVKGLDRDLITIEKRYEDEGDGFLTVALPALRDAFLQGLSTRQFTCPIGFRKVKGGAIPRFLSGMLCEVFDPLTGLLKEDADFGVIKGINNVLSLFKKTQLSPENEESLHSKAVNEFYQCDEVAAKVVIPDRHQHLIGRVCKLLLYTLNSKDIEYAKYKHGPGAVKEGYSANQKWEALFQAVKEDDLALQNVGIFGIGETPTQIPDVDSSIQGIQFRKHDSRRVRSTRRIHQLRASERLPNCKEAVQESSEVACLDGVTRGIAKLISVPKSSTARRTITIEPMLNQYVQQGLNILLRDSIKECKILGNCLALTDQSLNQKLALEGSLYDNWATIDLKSASDLLSLSLVNAVFRHHPEFLRIMMECRSPYVQSKGKPLLRLGKFAGMGNATTFPVQSVCYAVVCLAAILDSEGTSPTYWRLRRASRHIRVFGDDVIVSTKYAHQCVTWLTAVGLKVNDRKSFLSGNFKESCGVEAFKGVDITPLYIRHHPHQTYASPNVIASFVSLSNHMWLEGLYSASTWLKNEVERLLGRRLPLVSRDSGSFGWHSRLDAMEPHKWCRSTHRFLTRTLALAPIKKEDKLDGYAALLKCLSLAREENQPKVDLSHKDKYDKFARSLFPEAQAKETDHLERTSMRFRYRMKQRWVPSLVSGGINL
jgi:hypothetical protein